MIEHELEIPAEFVEAMQEATILELKHTAEALASNIDELHRHLKKHRGDSDWLNPADVYGTLGLLRSDVVLWESLLACEADKEVRVKGGAATLAHAAETAARSVIGPDLNRQLDFGPMDEESLEKIEPLTRALAWATGEAARLHAVAGAEIAASKAEAA